MKVKLLSHVQLFAIAWTVAHQAPPSTGFFRQEYWSGLPFPYQITKLIFLILSILICRLGTIKDRNCMDLEKQKILRRGGSNTQNYTKKDLHDLDNYDA